MSDHRVDALVVGAGPAGSIAALVLARGGARVALVDKAAFPRDKACGDLVGPRGVQVLHDLGVAVPAARRVHDMVVVGPTGRRVGLPTVPGHTYADFGLAVPRVRFDATLRDAALSAGAEPFVGRAKAPLQDAGELEGFVLDSGTRLRADVVIGADGAASLVAETAGLVDSERVLWGFATRSYVDGAIDRPHILFWEPSRGRGFPGYGWVFPGVDGSANVGLGLGVLSNRTEGRRAVRELDAFIGHATALGLIGDAALRSADAAPRLGGWLKMGLAGTTPAKGRVLLVGDAAGLINPLQGEGIAQAMSSGRAAADAVLAGDHTRRYLSYVRCSYAPYLTSATAVHRALLQHPKALPLLTRMLTAPYVSAAIAGGWSAFWNDLLDGAEPSGAAMTGRFAARVFGVLTSRSDVRHAVDRALAEPRACGAVATSEFASRELPG
jgi:menaquinone-9 beta-reductase